jgi:hypothetical protein
MDEKLDGRVGEVAGEIGLGKRADQSAAEPVEEVKPGEPGVEERVAGDAVVVADTAAAGEGDAAVAAAGEETEPSKVEALDVEMGEDGEIVVASGSAEDVRRESARRTRRSFVVGAAAAAAGYGALHWINNSPPVGRLQRELRRAINADAAINRAVWGERGLAPEYPLSRAQVMKLNGVVGLDETLDLSSWRLQLAGVEGAERFPQYRKDVTDWEYKYVGDMQMSQQMVDVKSAPKSEARVMPGDPQPPAVDGPTPKIGPGVDPAVKNKAGSALNPSGAVDSDAGAALAAHIEALMKKRQTKRVEGTAEAGASYSSLDIGTPGLLLSMADLEKLPKVDVCFEFKCIEGWSQIAQWGGYRLRDLLEMYPPAKVNGREPRYMYMETPDGDYYGGFDLKVARHPQTLLVTEMAGQPLAQEHGAPLRLYTPLKYGYKQIKRIGLIAYTDQKPDDFWTKLGYDWYAGL